MKKEKFLGKYNSVLYRFWQIYMNRELKEYDLLSSEFIFIVYISEDGHVNQKQICDELAIDQAMATRSMRNLEAKGFIVRQKNPHDGRAYALSLTNKGRTAKSIIQKKLIAWNDIIFADVSEENREQVLEIMYHCANNALKEVKNEL